jgi:transposase
VLSLPAQARVFVFTSPVDFRKQHDGLVAIVRDQLECDPLDGSLFAFFNRRRDRIKLLLWDANGFWLFYKRLEGGTFERLRDGGSARLRITRGELSMLLDGIEVNASKKRRHFADEIRVLRAE